MGYDRHHAIIVTTYNQRSAESARVEAVRIFAGAGVKPLETGMEEVVTPILVSPVNSYRTFVITTDGSNEGWKASDAGDEARAEFVKWLESHSGPFAWVEVQYGDDGGDTRIVNDSDAYLRKPEPTP